MRYVSSLVVLGALVALVGGCGDGDRDSGIYATGFGTFNDDEDDDEADEAESTEAGDATASDDDVDSSSSSSSDDDDPSTTNTTNSTSDDDPSTSTSSSTTTDDGESDGNGACGNGIIDGGEQCDGGQLGGMSCIDLGYTGGVLSCDPVICVYDTTECTNDGTTGNNNDCGTYCDECTCPSNACIMCCAMKDKVDACNGGMCSCF